MREVLLRPRHLGGNIIGRPFTPGVAAQRLWPQAERALRRTAARRVQRNVRMQQERHVVARYVHIARIDLCCPRHRVQIFHLRTVRVVLNYAVRILIADAKDLVQRFAICKFHDGKVKLAAANKVEHFALIQRAVGVRRHWRPDKGNLDCGIRFLDRACQRMIARPAHRRGKQHEKLKALRDLNGLLRAHMVGRCIEQLGAFEHPSRIGEPHRIPVGLDLTGRGPARAGTTVEVFKGRRV